MGKSDHIELTAENIEDFLESKHQKFHSRIYDNLEPGVVPTILPEYSSTLCFVECNLN